MSGPILALKVDVDTDLGTRDGVPALVNLFRERNIPATFLFSLGPDNTGKAIRRIFRPGFLKKVKRTKVGSTYPWRTLLSGTVLPAPHIGKRRKSILRNVRDLGFECGIHCYDHFKWQDYVHHFDLEHTRREFGKAVEEFIRIFEVQPLSAGAPGWQTNEKTLQVYDENNLLYGSDTRGFKPFLPRYGEAEFKTLQIPTTLPTLDELLGRPEFPDKSIPSYYTNCLRTDLPNVWTIHAEVEGQAYAGLFLRILEVLVEKGIEFKTVEQIAAQSISQVNGLERNEIADFELDGRSGLVANQIIA